MIKKKREGIEEIGVKRRIERRIKVKMKINKGEWKVNTERLKESFC